MIVTVNGLLKHMRPFDDFFSFIFVAMFTQLSGKQILKIEYFTCLKCHFKLYLMNISF